MQKLWSSLRCFLFAGMVVILCLYFYIQKVGSTREYVEIDQQTEKTIVFYRDDCSDCKKVMPGLIFKNIFSNQYLFVNMNNQENRRYINDYQLTEVPTFIKGQNRYSGIDVSEINLLSDK